MNSNLQPLLLAAAAGAVSGALVLGGFSWYTHDRPTEAVAQTRPAPPVPMPVQVAAIHPAERPSGRAAPVPADDTAARVVRLERQVEGLSGALRTAHPAPAPAPADPETAADALDIEHARVSELAAWEEKKRGLQGEAVDPKWSAKASDSFIDDLAGLSQENGFSVVAADCRTTQCAVVVEWPSYDDATAHFDALLHHNYQINCSRETLLPEPGESAAGPYQVTVLFNCG